MYRSRIAFLGLIIRAITLGAFSNSFDSRNPQQYYIFLELGDILELLAFACGSAGVRVLRDILFSYKYIHSPR